jgi:mycothiol synthase
MDKQRSGRLKISLSRIYRFVRKQAKTLIVFLTEGYYGLPASSQLRMLRKFSGGELPETPPLPEGYLLVSYQPRHEREWIGLLNSSGEFGVWDEKRLWEEMLEDLIPESAVFIEKEGRFVACAAACRFASFKPYGVLMYVVTLSEHRGMNLGKIATLGAMAACRKAGCPGVILQTDDLRQVAIKTYLKLGFKPLTGPSQELRHRWQEILESLDGDVYKKSMIPQGKTPS